MHTYEHSSLTSNLPPHPLKGALHQDSDAHILRRQTLVEDPEGLYGLKFQGTENSEYDLQGGHVPNSPMNLSVMSTFMAGGHTGAL